MYARGSNEEVEERMWVGTRSESDSDERGWTPAASQGDKATTKAAARPITLDDVVRSQEASGQFNINGGMRETLSSRIPLSTRDAIQSKVGDGDSNAVDTVLMTEYIQTEMDDEKDLLELVVDKAVKSVEGGSKEEAKT